LDVSEKRLPGPAVVQFFSFAHEIWKSIVSRPFPFPRVEFDHFWGSLRVRLF